MELSLFHFTGERRNNINFKRCWNYRFLLFDESGFLLGYFFFLTLLNLPIFLILAIVFV